MTSGPFTRHGHEVPGVTKWNSSTDEYEDDGSTDTRFHCGGVGECAKCGVDAKNMQASYEATVADDIRNPKKRARRPYKYVPPKKRTEAASAVFDDAPVKAQKQKHTPRVDMPWEQRKVYRDMYKNRPKEDQPAFKKLLKDLGYW